VNASGGGPFTLQNNLTAELLNPGRWFGTGETPFVYLGLTHFMQVALEWKWTSAECAFQLKADITLTGIPGSNRSFLQTGIYTGGLPFYHDSGKQYWPVPPDYGWAIGHTP